MATYKAGDRVRVTDPNASPHTDLGQTGTVVEDDSFAPWVEFDKPTRYPHTPIVAGVRRKEGFCDCLVEDSLEPLKPVNDLRAIAAVFEVLRATGLTVDVLAAYEMALALTVDAEQTCAPIAETVRIYEQSMFDDARAAAIEQSEEVRRMLALMGKL